MRRLTGGQLGKVMFIAVAVEGFVVVVTLVVSFLTKRAPATWQVFLVPVAGVLTAGVKAGAEALAADPVHPAPPASGGDTGYDGAVTGPGAPPPPGFRGKTSVPLFAVLAVLLVSCGGGGLAATAGVRYGYGWVTGNEPGTEVFRGKASGSAGGVRVTVTSAVVTAHFTKLDVAAENSGRNAVSLPLFGNCQLVGDGGKTLEADDFRSQWSDSVTPGVPRTGTITFPGKLTPGNAILSFVHIFGSGGGTPIVVRGIRIAAT
jgi:hypothetical protein